MKSHYFLLLFLFSFASGYAQKVGIGTTTPVNMLSVAGNMDVSGNVGIGIPNPSQKLEVNQDALIHDLLVGRGLFNNETNTALGISTLNLNSTGLNNTAMGYLALALSTTGNQNTAFGAYALNSNSSGSGNTAAGTSAMSAQTSGTNNTAIGYNARPEFSGLTNATAIGANALVSTSNSVILGDNANVGIGTSSPGAKLEVVGTTKSVTLQATSGAANNRILTTDANGLTSWVIPGSLETDPKVGSLTTHSVPKWNGSMMTNGTITDNGSQVGIGTTAPGARLDIVNIGGGIRLLSGAAGSNTDIQIGRTSTDGTLGVAAINGHYAGGSEPGDIILRNETTTKRIILNNGSSGSALVVTNGKVGTQTANPVNKLDVRDGLAVGATYSGTNTSIVNGAIIEGSLSIGATEPINVLRVANAFPKTDNSLHHISFMTTNEPLSGHPFGLRYSIQGNAAYNLRCATMQTTDVNLADGGNLILQPDTGQVGFGGVYVYATVGARNGIRTKYSNTTVITLNSNSGEASDEYDITINPPLPGDWDYTNTVFYATICDGAKGVIRRAKILNSSTARLTITNSNAGSTRINYIVFKI